MKVHHYNDRVKVAVTEKPNPVRFVALMQKW